MFATTPFSATAFGSEGDSLQPDTGWRLTIVDAPDVVVAAVLVRNTLALSVLDAADQVSASMVAGVAPIDITLAVQDEPDTLQSAFAAPAGLTLALSVADAPDTLLAAVERAGMATVALVVRDAPDTVQGASIGGRLIFGAIPRCRPAHAGSRCRPPNIQHRC
jgi:hypothetical protein